MRSLGPALDRRGHYLPSELIQPGIGLARFSRPLPLLDPWFFLASRSFSWRLGVLAAQIVFSLAPWRLHLV